MTDRSYRTRGRHTNRPLPAFMDGTKRDKPIARPTATYITVTIDDDEGEG